MGTMTKPPMDDLRFISGSLRAAAVPAPPGDRGPECLDDDTIAALADGRLETAARTAVIDHLASCDICTRAVAAVAGVLADPSVSREIAAVEDGVRRRLVRIIVPAAAAAVLLLLAWPPWSDDGGLLHRAPPTQAATAPVPISPVGAVARAETLRWASAAGADRYRVTLFDSSGRSLYEAGTRDTVVALPDSIVLVPGQSYLWKVEARTGWDRWSASELVGFRVAGGGSR